MLNYYSLSCRPPLCTTTAHTQSLSCCRVQGDWPGSYPTWPPQNSRPSERSTRPASSSKWPPTLDSTAGPFESWPQQIQPRREHLVLSPPAMHPLLRISIKLFTLHHFVLSALFYFWSDVHNQRIVEYDYAHVRAMVFRNFPLPQ